MKVILATNNEFKAKEIRKIFNIEGWEIFTLADLNLDSDPEETGTTFLENAMLKAESAREAAKNAGLDDYAIVADDSGLCVDALDGGPGIYSARYAEVNGQPCTYADNNKKLIKALDGIEYDKRTAHYVTVVAFIYPDGSVIDAKGTCDGIITTQEIGTNGFGYDPVFYSKDYEYKLTMAQLSAEQKDEISHRGRAFRALKEKLLENN